MAEEKAEPTIVGPPNTDPEADATKLYKAMKGWGTDEKAIIQIVAYRSTAQLKAIEEKFKTSYGKDLQKYIKSEISGKFEDAVIFRFYNNAEFSAMVCRKAMKGMGTDEKALIHTLCPKGNEEVLAIRKAFKAMYNRDLEKDVMSETSGDFRRMLVSALQGKRETDFDEDKAQKEAMALYQAGEAKWGTDEAVFNKILMLRSHKQLRATFAHYLKISGRDIEKAIKKELSGNFEAAALATVQYIKDPILFYANVLRASMKGAGTDDRTLIRTVMGRAEIDLRTIANRYAELFMKTLYKAVEGETSGDYRRMLLATIRK